MSRYGLPRQVLSDNGLCFTGRLHNVEVEFERNLKDIGRAIVREPQLQGLVEALQLAEGLGVIGPGIDELDTAST